MGDVSGTAAARAGLRPRAGIDEVIAAMASRQYGLVSTRQLRAAGISARAIETRVRRHGLHRLHRGVYVVGHTVLVPGAREMAAVLACGPGTAVSHRSAAALLALLDHDDAPIEVTVTSQSRARRGLVVHRSRTLTPQDVRPVRGIPTTTPARTLIDFAETAKDRELERALGEALTRRLTSRPTLIAAVERAHGRRGVPRLKSLLEKGEPASITRSEAEERFLALVRAAHLEPPEVNVNVLGREVDFLWRDRRLVVELDGYRFHSTRAAFERDRLRDGRLHAAGYRVTRVTWLQLTEDPFAVVASVSAALAARAA